MIHDTMPNDMLTMLRRRRDAFPQGLLVLFEKHGAAMIKLRVNGLS